MIDRRQALASIALLLTGKAPAAPRGRWGHAVRYGCPDSFDNSIDGYTFRRFEVLDVSKEFKVINTWGTRRTCHEAPAIDTGKFLEDFDKAMHA